MNKFFVVLLSALTVAAAACDRSPTRPDPVAAPALQSASIAPGSTSASPSASTGPKASEQVVFSGVANGGTTPVGFWIWCMAEAAAPSRGDYGGECNGSMYFYALGITRHVEGEIEETGEGLYTMQVSSTRDNAIVDCLLSNVAEPEHGPHNEVRVSCTTPSVTAVSTTAVVNVTGPGE